MSTKKRLDKATSEFGDALHLYVERRYGVQNNVGEKGKREYAPVQITKFEAVLSKMAHSARTDFTILRRELNKYCILKRFRGGRKHERTRKI